jgi:hypothetical protein
MGGSSLVNLKGQLADTNLYSTEDPELATNLKWVLTCFEQISGMRINYSKRELIPLCL